MGSVPAQRGCAPGLTFPQWLQTTRRRKRAKQPRGLWHAGKQNVTLKRGLVCTRGDVMLPFSHGTARGKVAVRSVVGCCECVLVTAKHSGEALERPSPARSHFLA